MRDQTLLAKAQELVDERASGHYVGHDVSYEDAFVAFAAALGQDTGMIYRLAREVDRLSREVEDLKRAMGTHPRS